MVKDPKKFRKYSDQSMKTYLQKLSMRESLRIGESLARAAFKVRKPRSRRDKPMALSFYVHRTH